jgi:hypothetical protein
MEGSMEVLIHLQGVTEESHKNAKKATYNFAQ